MDHPDDEYQSLQQQLDEAGRMCQPRDPGWDTLIDRLPPQKPNDETKGDDTLPKVVPWRSSSRWLSLAVAASVLVAIVLGVSFWPEPHRRALAENLPIEVQRRGIQITVFSESENREPTLFMPLVSPLDTASVLGQEESQMAVTQREMPMNAAGPPSQVIYAPRIVHLADAPGMALVKDQRMVLHLQKGDNVVKFTDVAATIDPTSVRLVSDTDPMGTKVVEQNFEFDLASADALLKKSLERSITCVGKGDEELFEGCLLSYDAQSIVLGDSKPSDDPDAARPKTQTITRTKLQAIRIQEVPKDLYTRPTLVWKLRTNKPGDHLTTLTYLCGNVVWRADYVAVVTDATPDEDTLDLKGWVTIDNRSGTTYEEAGLKLIAGDVNRVRDPWAPVPPNNQWRSYSFGVGIGRVTTGLSPRKEFTQKSFFEYKLYTLTQPSTIKDRQIKQIGLFKASGIKAVRRFVCRSNQGGNLHPEVQLLVKNEKENSLGRPLPKGMLALMAVDGDGDSHLLGRHEIDHTPKDEELDIDMGQAFDVVYGYRVVKTERPARRRMIQTYEYRIRNHKPTAVHVRAIGELAGYTNWTITRTSDEYSKHDFKTLHFDFRLEPDTEKTITYTVDYQW